jgi:sarcosine oxidase
VGSLDFEVAVVGAGVMGLATARALARAGRDVVLLEQFALGHDRGSSHGTSRIFRFSYPEEEWVRLAQEALPLWRELEAEAGEPLLELHGSVDLGDWGANRDALAAAGADFEILDRGDAERRFGLALDAGERALFQPDGGIALADRTLTALAASIGEHGGEIREETRVIGLEESGGGVRVELEGSVLEAGAAVVTAGAWAPRLVELVDALPTRETTAYFPHDGPVPSLMDTTLEAGAIGYALGAPGRGTKASIHKTGPRTDPDAPGEPDRGISLAAGEWLARRFPGISSEPVHIETCVYTNLEGDRFTCERRGSIVVGSPCSGHGFKFAPLIGRNLAQLAAEAL